MEAQAIQTEFQFFLQDLVNVEKKVIHALTDVARDILRTRPQGAPVVAAVIIDRVLKAPVSLKLPTLYLLDSIVKLVGEPYTSYFALQLPEAFAATWQAGNANLHKSLQKLYSTWTGVFPQHVLTEVAARVGQLPGVPAAPQQYAAPIAAVPSYYAAPQQVAALPAQPVFAQQPAGVLGVGPGYLVQQLPQMQQPLYVQPQPQPAVSQPAYAAAAQPEYAGLQQQPTFVQQQQQQLQPAAVQPPVNVADLMASLVNSGILAVPAQAGAAQPPAAAGAVGDSTPPAASTPLRPEEPVSLEFTPERIKEKNPAAMHRLLEQTEHTKGQFLDRKFLRRQRRSGAQRLTRLWYLDLDTWLVAGAAQQQQEAVGAAAAAPAAAAATPEQCSVPVDESQTHCALSGERFQQFWDERHQEWRYKDAKPLDADEAARYGLEEGAIVLVSALGAPASNPLQPATGVLSSLVAEQEIAADLAAATAAVGPGDGAAAGAEDAKDVKVGTKHERDEEELAAPGHEQLEQKRLRVH